MRDAHRAMRHQWLTEQQMRDAMQPPTIEEIFAAGEFARCEAARADVSDWWVGLVLAFAAGMTLGVML